MNISRRWFLKDAAGAALFAAGGCSLPPPSERLNVAVIGCGTMGLGNMWGFLKDSRVRVTVTCDPVRDAKVYGYDSNWKNKERGGREGAKLIVDDRYGAKDCRAVADWREVVDDPTVDAVCIATPDHWHAIIAIAAMKRGKHVFCQKPLAMSIAEGRRMCEVAKENGVVFQVGSQQRSDARFRQAAEIIRNGYLEGCRTCRIGLSYPHNDSTSLGFTRDTKRYPTTPDWWKMSPSEWNMWLGPSQHWENDAYIPGIHGAHVWRWNDRTGCGTLPDWGAHHLDILQWALGRDDGGPVAIENVTSDFGTDVCNEVFNWPASFQFDVVYADGFRATVSDSKAAGFNGLKFDSPKGALFVNREKIELPKPLKSWRESDLKAGEAHLHVSRGSHEADFIDAILDRSWQPACPCEVGHRSITISHLANSCIKTGLKGVKWDPAKETSSSAEVNARFDIRRHNGWKLEI